MEHSGRKTFKASPRYLLPVISVAALATVLAVILQFAYEVPPSAFWLFPEEGFGILANTLYFILILALAGTLFYLLVKRGHVRVLTPLIAMAYGGVGFALASVYLPVAFWAVGLQGSNIYLQSLIAASVAFTVIIVYGALWGNKRLRLATMLFVGAALGALLGFSSTTLTAFTILLALAVYDVFAVFKGPLGKMVSVKEGREVRGLMVPFGELSIGLGDLVFYSMLVSHIYLALGVAPFAAGLVGLMLGAYLTFKQLEKRRIFPGLPLTLTLAMGLSLLTYYLPSLVAKLP